MSLIFFKYMIFIYTNFSFKIFVGSPKIMSFHIDLVCQVLTWFLPLNCGVWQTKLCSYYFSIVDSSISGLFHSFSNQILLELSLIQYHHFIQLLNGLQHLLWCDYLYSHHQFFSWVLLFVVKMFIVHKKK